MPLPTTIDVSIIIVNWNTCDLLRACLNSIFATIKDALSIEILVVDNASTDVSQAMIASDFPTVRLIQNEDNVGFAAANNQALEQATGKYCFFLNSDTELIESALVYLVAVLEGDALVGAAGPQLLNAEGSVQPSFGDFPSLKIEFFFQTYLFKILPIKFPLGRRVRPLQIKSYQVQQVVDWVTAAAILVRRDLAQQIGGFDTSLFMYGEDVELCWQVQTSGYQVVYVPEARVFHHLGGSRSNYARWINSYSQGHLTFYQRHRSRFTLNCARLLIICGSLLRIVLWSCLYVLLPSKRAEIQDRVKGYWKVTSAISRGSTFK